MAIQTLATFWVGMLGGASAAGKQGNENNAEQDPGDRRAGGDSTATRLSAILRPNKGRCEQRVKLAGSLFICEHWRRGAVNVVTLTSDMYHRASGVDNRGMCLKADRETGFERR